MTWRVIEGDVMAVLPTLPAGGVRCCVTSPPYWGLRDYGHPGQLGLEPTPEAYVARMVEVFREVRRVLAGDGTLWLNLGDSYAATGKSGGGLQGERWEDRGAIVTGPRGGRWSPAPPGLKPKDLVGIPWRVAFALQADGWWLRQDIVWAKPNPMPESVTDRCTKAHEYVFLLTKAARYYYDADAVKEEAGESSGWAKQRAKGENTWKYNDSDERTRQTGQSVESSTLGTVGVRNKRSVWAVATQPFRGAHFAVMPEALAESCVRAGTAPGDAVLDPFAGSGTVGAVADRLGRDFIGIELNPEYAAMARRRIAAVGGPLFTEGDNA